MGAKKKDGGPRKPAKDKLSEVVAGLAEADATTVSRVRSVASALQLEKVIGILDASEEVVTALNELFRRSPDRLTIGEAAEKTGLTVDQIRQLNLASGFADPGPDARVLTDEDVEILQAFQVTTEFFGQDVAMQIIRVMGSAMSRVADAFISSFAVSVGRQSLEGDFGVEELAQANEAAVSLLPGAMHAMDVLLRRHLELKSRTSFVVGKEWEGVDTLDRAIAFCDLVGYTAMAQQTETTKLSSMLREFEVTASDLITARGANVVKLIGDEVMFVAPDAKTAADVALALSETFDAADALPPVRCGLAAGSVILREGDYHGPVVNLAARIVKLAPPGGVVAPRSLVGELGDVNTEDVGTRDLKGFEEPVDLVRIVR